ncbi:uncharacterized protein LOC123917569 [Trifolium pratense]|uniref:uncharacterized protein LOC123917569 n=1 Tax=Trifolium pratense TaxID=57577 RepID=UPI001E693A54|nr:uncharacterized protein LOC123917569 [Trifolium pratense]
MNLHLSLSISPKFNSPNHSLTSSSLVNLTSSTSICGIIHRIFIFCLGFDFLFSCQFQKLIVEPGGNSPEGLKASDVDPRVVFHQGIPSGAAKFAYDPIQKILALSTKDGRIKLYGKIMLKPCLIRVRIYLASFYSSFRTKAFF